MIKAREQLDVVLKYLYDKRNEMRAVDIEVIKTDQHLLKSADTVSELERMILKLREDKFLQMYPDYPHFADGKQDMSKGLLNYCSITFDGRLFWENGGYAKEAELIATSEKIKNNREIYLLYGTWGVAIGAIALVAWEIIKTFFIENHPCH